MVEDASSQLESVIDQEAIAPVQGLDENTVPLPE